jgi:phosphatidylglycerol:prolipoprotein diacylglycerol transferase
LVLELANCIFLVWLLRRKKFDGEIIGTYLIIYGIGRYFIEFFRGDPGRGELFGFMSGTQGIALLLVIAGGLLWLRRVPLRQTANLSRSAGVS